MEHGGKKIKDTDGTACAHALKRKKNSKLFVFAQMQRSNVSLSKFHDPWEIQNNAKIHAAPQNIPWADSRIRDKVLGTEAAEYRWKSEHVGQWNHMEPRKEAFLSD